MAIENLIMLLENSICYQPAFGSGESRQYWLKGESSRYELKKPGLAQQAGGRRLSALFYQLLNTAAKAYSLAAGQYHRLYGWLRLSGEGGSLWRESSKYLWR